MLVLAISRQRCTSSSGSDNLQPLQQTRGSAEQTKIVYSFQREKINNSFILGQLTQGTPGGPPLQGLTVI